MKSVIIPTKAEELTPEYFEAVLKHKFGPDTRVVCSDVRPAFATKMGFMATHLKATVVTSSGDKAKRLLSLFIKLVPLGDPFFMAFLSQLRYDVREVRFFDEVAAELDAYLAKADRPWKLPIPRLAFSSYCPDEPKSILALYDTSEDGYKSGSLAVGWDLPHLLVGVRTLAKVNAASVSYMLTHGLDFKGVEAKFPNLKIDFSAIADLVQFHVQYVSDLAGDLAVNDGGKGEDEAELLANLEQIKEWGMKDFKERYEHAMSGPFVALAQRDCWNNNFMFKYDPSTGEPVDAILCDWQWGSMFNVTADLACLLYTSVDADLRQSSMKFVLAEYFRTFCQVLKSLGTFDLFPPVTFEQFLTTFRDVGLHSAFESLKVLRIAFSRSDEHFPGNPIMTRFCASLREVLRERIKSKLW